MPIKDPVLRAAYNSEYRKKNAEYLKAQKKIYWAANSEKFKPGKRIYWAVNRPALTKQKRDKYNMRRSNGTCGHCDSPIFCKSKRCERHFFMGKANDRIGDSSRWEEIQKLFYSQNQRCYLTGRLLVPGINASLDHIKPQSKNPELYNKIENIRWCDIDVNKAKNKLSNEELFKLCEDVLRYKENKI
jgi:hypothetical protein